MTRNRTRAILLSTLLVGVFLASAQGEDDLLKASGVQGGLVVHLGCGEGELTAAFGGGEAYLVQGLDADPAKVAAARRAIRAQGLYGRVTVKHWSAGHLPFADGVVNLLVVSANPAGVSLDEMKRVLAPRGVLCEGSAGAWKKSVTPWPDRIDEWTHYLHDASGNAVAKDTVVGPPRSLRWNGGPKYSRNHEIDASVVALVSAKGRFLYMVDEGEPGLMGKHLPQTWALAARDAFSGVILWKRPVPEMGWPQWKPELKDADWTKLIAQRRLIPITLPRRLVAVGDRVYTTFGYDAPLAILDAATGRTVKTCKETQGTDEILHHDGMLVLCVRPETRESLEPEGYDGLSRSKLLPINNPGIVMALDAASGEVLWRNPPAKMLPLSLTVGGDRVFYHNGAELICLDRKTGKQQWSAPNTNASANRWNVSHSLVAHGNVLLIGTAKKIEAMSAETGKLLWTAKGGRSGFGGANPTNLYVIGGLVWAPSGSVGNPTVGYDLLTGEVKKSISLPQYFYTAGHHVRCYRGKATERYILEHKRGIEMMDLQGDNHTKNDWVRGLCRYGVMPCNGLIYSTPTPCSCYPTVQLHGFNALASQGGRSGSEASTRLVKGKAYDDRPAAAGPLSPEAWPAFRGGNLRNGSSSTRVGPAVAARWSTKLGGRLTQPVVAGGKLFLASIDEQTVHALDADKGTVMWSYTADGRVDSPPTYRDGMVLFGCRNGWVYNVSADDGRLIWRYRAAPADDQIVSYNQLESLWPVHGSVLVVGNTVYAAAGRNSYLDGGIYLVGLDIATGRKLHEGCVAHKPQDPAADRGGAHDMVGAKPDVLASDGELIFMQCVAFDKTLKPVADGSQESGHIYATAGYLDDLAWNRNAWKHSRGWPAIDKKDLRRIPKAGQLLVTDGTSLYGVKYFLDKTGQSSVFYPGEKGYYVFAEEADVAGTAQPEKKGKRKKGASQPNDGGVLAAALWDAWIPIRVRAMVKTRDALFFAGPPDVVDPKDPTAAFEGRKGAILKAVSAKDGKPLAELTLDSPPVFDGLIAAHGRLYLTARDGSVRCFATAGAGR